MAPPPLPLSEEAARAVAEERLRLLSLGYYISGTISVICVSFLLIHLAFFTAFSFVPDSSFQQTFADKTPAEHVEKPAVGKKSDQVDLAFLRVIFRFMAVVMACIVAVGWFFGGLTIYAGRCIAKRQSATFVKIMAGINCLMIPYGTLLGVATFMTLPNDAVRKLY